MKVIEKIQESLVDEKKVVFSFEFFPPKTEDGVENLLERMDRMVAHDPAFCDALRACQPLHQNRRHRHHKMLANPEKSPWSIYCNSGDRVWTRSIKLIFSSITNNSILESFTAHNKHNKKSSLSFGV
ncbi:hypothetical protein ACFX2I_006929 [Malus domestica]